MLPIFCRGSSGGKYVDEPRNVSTAKWKALRTQAPLAKSAANSPKTTFMDSTDFIGTSEKTSFLVLKTGFIACQGGEIVFHALGRQSRWNPCKYRHLYDNWSRPPIQTWIPTLTLIEHGHPT